MISSAREGRGFFQERLPDGSLSWTLTSAFGQFLSEAEELFGQRDKSWTPLGVEIHDGIPDVWFPGSYDNAQTKHISIRVSDHCLKDARQGMFQVAHEVIHVLSPLINKNANVLEEGIATWFADHISFKYNLIYTMDVKSYIDAKNLVSPIIKHDPKAILNIRNECSDFYSVTPDVIRRFAPQVSRPDAEALCETFKRDA